MAARSARTFGPHTNRMTSKLQLLLLKYACRLAMRRPAPDRIPRSLPRAAGIDCFSFALTGRDNAWSLLVDSAQPEGVTGRWLHDESYSAPASVAWSIALDATIDCSHYIGVHEFQYNSTLHLLVREALLLPRLEVFRNRFQQNRFNRQRLVRHERIAILRVITEESLKRRDYRVSSVTLAANLYSNRVFFHPHREQLLNYCSLLLDSLVESGDLTLQNHTYGLSPGALQTIAAHEEEDRRHQDMLSQQRAVKWLTFALIFVGLLQAYAGWKSG